MKGYTHLIWDFNGTLLDDVGACIRAANRLLSAHDLPMLASVEHYRRLFGFPIIDYYRRLGFDFSRLRYADLAVEWVAYYLEESRDCALYPDAIAALLQMRESGLRQILLSATERQMLTRQVEGLGIADCFDEILGLDNIHAYSKESIGLAFRAAHPDAEILLVGDTDHDAAVAAAMDADCMLIARGHQSAETLEGCRSIGVLPSLAVLAEGLLCK